MKLMSGVLTAELLDISMVIEPNLLLLSELSGLLEINISDMEQALE
jgi:hypothetical protein